MQRAFAIALAAAVGLAGGCKGKSKETKGGDSAATAGTGPATPKPRPHPPKQRPATEPDVGFEERRRLLLERGDPALMKAQEPVSFKAPDVKPEDMIKPIDKDNLMVGSIKVNLAAGRAEIQGKTTAVSGPLEYIAVAEGGTNKAYESLFTVTTSSMELRLALSLIGYEGATPVGNDRTVPAPSVDDTIQLAAIYKGKERPITAYLYDKKTKKPPKGDLLFQVIGFRPEDRDQALLTRDLFTLVARDVLAPVRVATDLGNPYAGPDEGTTTNLKLIPNKDEPITLVLKRRPEKPVVPLPGPMGPMGAGMPTMPMPSPPTPTTPGTPTP